MLDLRNMQKGRQGTADDPPLSGAWGSLLQRMRRLAQAFNLWLWVFVLLPTLLAAVYFFGIASDLYLTEAKFIVRTQSSVPASLLGAFLQDTGLVRSSDDTFSVNEFIMSRDAVRDLERENGIREIFGRPEADFITRFPNPISGSSFEALYRHYGDFVEIRTDSSTGVSTLRVKAYRPEDAQAIAAALLQDSERLVNTLNQRAEHDALELARREVTRAQQHLAEADSRLTAYRLQVQILDPKLTSTNIYETLAQISAAKVSTETMLAQLTRDAPTSPAIPGLQTRLAALKQQMAETEARITGGDGSVATKVAEFERLTLERELAERQLASATESLEKARIDVARQALYIEHIVQPNLADYPLYPKRVVSFVMVLVTCFLAYSIAWLLIAGVREHATG